MIRQYILNLKTHPPCRVVLFCSIFDSLSHSHDIHDAPLLTTKLEGWEIKSKDFQNRPCADPRVRGESEKQRVDWSGKCLRGKKETHADEICHIKRCSSFAPFLPNMEDPLTSLGFWQIVCLAAQFYQFRLSSHAVCDPSPFRFTFFGQRVAEHFFNWNTV